MTSAGWSKNANPLSRCQHAPSSANSSAIFTSSSSSSADWYDENQWNDWSGSKIDLKHNGVNVAFLPGAFKKFEYCFEMDEIDVINDKFQLQSTTDDAACISSLSINNTQLLVGKNNNLQSFWIDGNDNYCLDDFMTTSQMTIQNGQVISSLCKPSTSKWRISLKPFYCSDRFSYYTRHRGQFSK